MLEKDLLKDVPLLSELESHQLEELMKITIEKDYVEGDIVFSEGDESTELYILVKGEVEIQIKMAPQLADSTVYTVKPYDVFGEFAFTDSMPRSASARCIKNATVGIIKRDDFEELIRKHAEIGHKFYRGLTRLLSDRLRRMNTYLKNTYLRSLGIEGKS